MQCQCQIGQLSILSVDQVWLGDFASRGFLTDLTDRVEKWVRIQIGTNMMLGRNGIRTYATMRDLRKADLIKKFAEKSSVERCSNGCRQRRFRSKNLQRNMQKR